MNLKNKRILITRPRAQADEFANALTVEGAQPIFFPVIKIIPPDDFSDLDDAIRNLHQYNWLILTSVHTVDAFIGRYEFLGLKQLPLHLQVAVVGSKTARCLSEHGIFPNYVPKEYSSDAILNGLGENISGKRFLLPQSNLASSWLGNEIRQAGGQVNEVIAYLNIKNQPDSSAMHELILGLDIVTFTSPSTVNNFVEILKENGFDPNHLPDNPLFACIGPSTKKAAEEIGLTNLITADQHTTAGIIETLGNLVLN